MTTADTLLSLERARFELRMPDDDTSQDVLLSGLIASAISSLSKDTSVPLLDSNVEITVHLTGRSGVQVYDPYLKSITSVSYQAASEDCVYGLFPKTVIKNRCTFTPGERKGAFVVKPRGYQSWPDAAYNRFRIEGIAGLADDDPDLAAYRSATVLLFRSLYDGVPILREDSAYERIIRPLGRKDLRTFNLIGLVIPVYLSVNMGTEIGLVPDLLASPPVRLPEYLGVNMGTRPGITPVLTVGNPAASMTHLRIGWVADSAAGDAVLKAALMDTAYDVDRGLIPAGFAGPLGAYLVVWRADQYGGDPGNITFNSGFPSRNIFGPAAALSVGGDAGQVLITVVAHRFNILSGATLEVS